MARRVNPTQERLRKAELEKAAYQAIYQRGYAGVTLDDIARQAGVSKGTLVYHFGSKSGLLVAVMKRFTHAINLMIRRSLRQAQTPHEKLLAYATHQFFSVETTRQFCTVSLDFLAAANRDATLMDVQRQFLTEQLALDMELARLGLGHPEERARMIRALVEGLSVRFLADPQPQLAQYREECVRGLQAILRWDMD